MRGSSWFLTGHLDLLFPVPIRSLPVLWAGRLAVLGGVRAPDAPEPFATGSLLGPSRAWSVCSVSYPDLQPYSEFLLLYGTWTFSVLILSLALYYNKD